MSRPATHRRIVAVVALSLLFPGLGHMILGRFGRALVWLGGLFLIVGLTSEAAAGTWQAFTLVGALGAFAALDGVLIAREQRA